MDSETGRSKGYGFISVTEALLLEQMLCATVNLNHFNAPEVCRCGVCKEGVGAAERVWVGGTSHEGGACYRAFRFFHRQLFPGQRWAGEDWHRPRHDRPLTAHGSTGRRFVTNAALHFFIFLVVNLCSNQCWTCIFSTGTGLKIPPAAQQALQMTGSIAFGGIPPPAGEGQNDSHPPTHPPNNLSNRSVSFFTVPTPVSSQALNLPSQPLATHCLQLSNLFNPQV